jgi:hypothetical protein
MSCERDSAWGAFLRSLQRFCPHQAVRADDPLESPRAGFEAQPDEACPAPFHYRILRLRIKRACNCLAKVALLSLPILLTIAHWKRGHPALRAYFVANLVLLAVMFPIMSGFTGLDTHTYRGLFQRMFALTAFSARGRYFCGARQAD